MRALVVSIVLVVAAGAAPRAAHADDTVAEVEAKRAARQVLIVLRVLAYDKALATRAPGDDVTVIVVSAGTPAARADRGRWVAGFGLLPKVKVGGRGVRVRSVDYISEAAFTRELAAAKPGAIIVGDGLGRELAGVRAAARAARVLSFSVREPDVRAGVSVGIVPAAERDEIVINLEASRAEGAKLAAGLLQLARLVEGTP